jgi:hypothetical protein
MHIRPCEIIHAPIMPEICVVTPPVTFVMGTPCKEEWQDSTCRFLAGEKEERAREQYKYTQTQRLPCGDRQQKHSDLHQR